MTPALNLTDGYKVDHRRQFPKNTTRVVDDFKPRKSRMKGVNEVVWIGAQYLIKRYFIKEFNDNFFSVPREEAVRKYTRRINNYLPPGHTVTFEHVGDLHDLGFLPIVIKALPEGSRVPIGVPPFVYYNTKGHKKRFHWIPNYLETVTSCTLWPMCQSATTADQFRQKANYWADLTVGNRDFVPWQCHDFSFRGMFGVDAAMMSGASHLTSFYGTDTIPAIDFLEEWYNADSDKEIVGGSVAATEHSVMCLGTGLYIWDKYNGNWDYQGEAEYDLFVRIITEVYPSGIVSIVGDTWNLWRVVSRYLPQMKEIILARNGKVVLRPDSSPKTPVEILVGDVDGMSYGYEKEEGEAATKGLVEALWDIFGGTITEKGYKLLDPHVGAIYGDSITLERFDWICEGLAKKGFASINWVAGVGSYTYTYVTRDTLGWAMKATYGEVILSDGREVGIEIFKDPITDDGTKKSARGLQRVDEVEIDGKKTFKLTDRVTWEEFEGGALVEIFRDGKLLKETSLAEIRQRLGN